VHALRRDNDDSLSAGRLGTKRPRTPGAKVRTDHTGQMAGEIRLHPSMQAGRL